MERLLGVEQFADEIDTVMREQDIDRDTAAIVVAMRHGDLVGDVLIVGTLTDEQKRRRRRTLREVMIELGELDDDTGSIGVDASRPL
jgi:RPA family protein